jgi:hypothetical protein
MSDLLNVPDKSVVALKYPWLVPLRDVSAGMARRLLLLIDPQTLAPFFL